MRTPRKRSVLDLIERRPVVPVAPAPLGGVEGVPGADGSKWFWGSGAPSSELGANGDLYLRTSNGDVYGKSGGSWSVVDNLTGPKGDTGEGKEGPAGANGGGSLIGEQKTWWGVALPVVEGEEWKWEDGAAVSRTTYKALFETICIVTTGNRTSGSKALKSIPSTTGMKVGMPVSGTGIQSGSTIEAVNSSTEITLTKTASSTGTGGALVVAPNGVGDGSTTFNLPDSRGRATVAPDDMGGSDAGRITTEPQRLGGSGGTERHTLTAGQIAKHKHSVRMRADGTIVGNNLQPTAGGNTYAFHSSGTFGGVGSAGADGNSGEAGGDESHPNMQPFNVANKIIRVA